MVSWLTAALSVFVFLQATMQPFQGEILQEESQAVEELVSTLADTNLLRLSGKKQHMVEVGKKIEHLHPLDFLHTVLTSPRLRKHCKALQKSNAKWRVFVGGMSRGLMRAIKRDEFPQELDRFFQSLKLESSSLKELIEQKKWEIFLKRILLEVELKQNLAIAEYFFEWNYYRLLSMEIGLKGLVKKLG